MRRVISLVLALMICMSLAVPAFAATFTPSAENKGAPDIVEIKDQNNKPAAGKLTGAVEDGKEYVYEKECLVVTSIKDAKTSSMIPDASEKALLDVYNGLKDGSLKIPYEKLDSAKADKLVVRDLFDISMICVGATVDHHEMLEDEDVSLEVNFKLGIGAKAKVYVMVYKNNEWQKIEKVTNNGDGTITCVFEHLCPVAIIVEAAESAGGNMTTGTASYSSYSNNPKTGDVFGQQMALWIGVMVVSVAALAAVVMVNRKKQK